MSFDVAKLLQAATGKDDSSVNTFEFKEGVTVQLRYVPPDEMRKRTKAVTTTKFRRGKREEVVDDEQLNDDMIDHVIVSWNGFTVKDKSTPPKDVPLTCTRENKIQLVRAWAEFSQFVFEHAFDWETFSGEDAKAALGN